eukprot:1878871-Prymnesium_polylepis.1
MVQLPPLSGAAALGKKAKGEADAFGKSLVYESPDGPDTPPPSGSVVYAVSVNSARSQGTVHLVLSAKAEAGKGGKDGRKTREARASTQAGPSTAKGSADLATRDLATRWLDRLVEDTEEAISEAIGHIREVQSMILWGAAYGKPFRELPELAVQAGLKGADNKNLMLRSICLGIDPAITVLYHELEQLVRTSMDVEDEDFMAKIFPDKERADDSNMPKAFFQVACCPPQTRAGRR